MTKSSQNALGAGPAIAENIDSYFSTISSTTSKAPVTWETRLVHQLLRACRSLVSELEKVQLETLDCSVLDTCRRNWDEVESDIKNLLYILRLPADSQKQHPLKAEEFNECTAHTQPRCLVCASRQTIKALRIYIVSLASSSDSSITDRESLKAITEALHAAAIDISQVLNELNNTGDTGARAILQEDAAQNSRVVKDEVLELNKARSKDANTDDSQNTIQNALNEASKLAEMLHIFARISGQRWVSARLQLTHSPSIPSPLAAGSTSARHRRWVSQEIEGDTSAAASSGLEGDINNRHFSAGKDHLQGALHVRNRSDSRIQAANLQSIFSLRKSALSLRKTSQPQPQLPLQSQPGVSISSMPDSSERSKQVRFQEMPSNDSSIDQVHLDELVQLLTRFETAITELDLAHRDHCSGDNNGNRDAYVQAIRGLMAAFVQLSRLSSTSGLVKHYDKAALAQFKITTQAIRLLTVLLQKYWC
ncbi:hypothetical protein COEREDRAFT_81526 [Coemansia reversa NRRL 1564]|uniref:Uncharacterized protein n=1 Tax=Coemansia reversa (strain ATCC 12441 / NRRL 1564) TaxID=763665 RepID=A0A2G5BAP9_COERN|nr:hypothetical protein COEREDRAFT_81526 [Coemansia reversa NRRL 1564]|eukprot:PIA16083.1 hypothetical protein COEREDRAFT_81526 [Coemansia reversa NRRL 1564]